MDLPILDSPAFVCSLWLLSLSMFSRLVHVVMCISVPLLLWLNNIPFCGYTTFSLSIHWLVTFFYCCGQCCCKHLCTSFCTFIFCSLRYIIQSVTAGSYSIRSIFWGTVKHSNVTLHPPLPKQSMRVAIFPHGQHLLLSIFLGKPS